MDRYICTGKKKDGKGKYMYKLHKITGSEDASLCDLILKYVSDYEYLVSLDGLLKFNNRNHIVCNLVTRWPQFIEDLSKVKYKDLYLVLLKRKIYEIYWHCELKPWQGRNDGQAISNFLRARELIRNMADVVSAFYFRHKSQLVLEVWSKNGEVASPKQDQILTARQREETFRFILRTFYKEYKHEPDNKHSMSFAYEQELLQHINKINAVKYDEMLNKFYYALVDEINALKNVDDTCKIDLFKNMMFMPYKVWLQYQNKIDMLDFDPYDLFAGTKNRIALEDKYE